MKKLIARLQTLNKLDQVQQIETGYSQDDQPQSILNRADKEKFTPLFYHGNIKDTKKLLKEFKPSFSKEIEHVFLVGFHHIVGSQVEFIYPPLDEDSKQVITTNFLQKIAQQALPDGSHLTEFGQVYFILHDEKSLFHCVSSYGQIEASKLPQEDSVSRSFVQKAVCVMTKVPIYGLLKDKVHMIMKCLFD